MVPFSLTLAPLLGRSAYPNLPILHRLRTTEGEDDRLVAGRAIGTAGTAGAAGDAVVAIGTNTPILS